ncbi:MAG: DEAD/DEAH box helicase, partial [Culicoidibacterales bacterium]
MEQTQTFTELGYTPELVEALAKQEITAPTWVQAESASAILAGNDVIAQAHTGSGKTLAFVLPLFMRLDATAKTQQALILAPTHELVMQIHQQIQLLAENSGIGLRSVPLIGDANVNKQIERLKLQKPQIIVGTPGRVHDLLKKKKVTAHTLQTLILDEADNLLENTNASTIGAIIKATMRSRQVLVFSATIGEKAMEIAKNLMQAPTVFQQGNIRSAVNPNIEHFYVTCDRRDKFSMLRKLLAATQPQKALIFINTGESVDDITNKLNFHNFKTASIYGTLEKEERKAALDSFRDGSIQILISSDISARGLDISGITHVFNLDMPLLANEYLHRAGRSARGHAHGTCISIVAENEATFLKKYDRAFDIKLKQKEVREGQLVDLDVERLKKDAKIAAERLAERQAKKAAELAERANKPIRIYDDGDRPVKLTERRHERLRDRNDSNRGGFRGNDRNDSNRGGFRGNNRNDDRRDFRSNDRNDSNRGGFRGNDRNDDRRDFRSNDRNDSNRGGFRGNDRNDSNRRDFRSNDRNDSNRGGFRGNDRNDSNRGGFRGNDRNDDRRDFRGNNRNDDRRDFRSNDRNDSNRGGFRGNDRNDSNRGGFRGNDRNDSNRRDFRSNDRNDSNRRDFRSNDRNDSNRRDFRSNDRNDSNRGGFRGNDRGGRNESNSNHFGRRGDDRPQQRENRQFNDT